MNKLETLNRWWHSIQTRSSLAIIITAALLVETTSAVQYWYAREGIRSEVEHRAENELRVKNLEVERIVGAAEATSNATLWTLEERINGSSPEKLHEVLRGILGKNTTIVGAGIGFTPNYYADKGRWCELYALKNDNGKIDIKEIGSKEHDYLTADWYTIPMKTGKAYWTEPYFDDAGGKTLMITYAQPIRNKEGKIVAVFGVDVALDWLAKVINANHIYPSSYNLIVSRTGQLMACPVESLVMRKTLQDVTSQMKDTSVQSVNRQMLAGNSGQAVITDDKGEKNYVFFAPISRDSMLSAGEQLGWSMAVVCSDREIYSGLRKTGAYQLMLMLAGLALLTYIIMRTIRSARRLRLAEAEQARITNELNVAQRIQQAMLPKVFPPYPERNDIDIYASLTPAKEVGGDFYDYFLRDEKLFFCIGDVSGKGVPAALVMAMAQSAFRMLVAKESSPERIVTQMNNTLGHRNEYNIFITMLVGVLDLPTGKLRYCNAGHKQTVLLTQDSELRNMDYELPCSPNLPVGVMTDWTYNLEETTLKPGTTLFLYTDGLTEAENQEYAQFGKVRMMQTLKEATGCHPQEIINRVEKAIRLFVGETEQSDDLTMLAIHFNRQDSNRLLHHSITLTNDVSETPKLAELVETTCEELGLSASDTMQVNLSIEEAVVNVMNYAYPSGMQGNIEVVSEADTEQLRFIITDKGKPFDPTTRDEIDTTLSTDERAIGGLGIHLMRRYMDSINYERIGEKNILTLRKKIKRQNNPL